MHSVDVSLSQLAGSKIFSKLDAKSGFWQSPLNERFRPLTCFITPFRRLAFNRLPFGLSSASELFQRTMSQILAGLQRVVCHMDDILVHAADRKTHDQCLHAVLQSFNKASLTLNEKCDFARTMINFLGHIIDGDGVHADPAKISDVMNFQAPRMLWNSNDSWVW